MPVSNIFDRIACFYREKSTDGRTRIKRIPWDLLSYGDAGFLASPMPVSLNPLSEVTTSTTIISDVLDMLYEDDQNDHIDEVVDIMWFDSEADFYSKFEGVFGFYDSDPKSEFGY